MKVFKDLKVGDTIYVGFEKKEVTEIKLDHPLMYDVSICTSDGDWYVTTSYLPFDYNYSINALIATDKEAIIKYYADELTNLQFEFENKNTYLMKMLEKARNIKTIIKGAYEKKKVLNQINKIKPKFKVGDFIVNDYCMGKVIIITGDAYLLDTGQGISFSCNNTHLWTIQDAKEGDVLCYETKNELRIFIYDKGQIHYHCCYYNEHLTTIDSYFVIQDHLLYYIHPATKGQCDLLFLKMKEAGYEWDTENKKLKKINKEVKTRLMTNQELSDWLCQCPKECRETKYKKGSTVYKYYSYYENEANDPAEDMLIRKNHGEWKEPLINN